MGEPAPRTTPAAPALARRVTVAWEGADAYVVRVDGGGLLQIVKEMVSRIALQTPAPSRGSLPVGVAGIAGSAARVARQAARLLVQGSALAAFTPPPIGKGNPKRSWPPCAACGDANGPIRKKCATPKRTCGARFGIAGDVCDRCYGRFFKAQRKGAA